MNPLFDKPFTFDRVARIIFGLAAISGIIYLIAVLRNALLPFLIAWLLAYMMQPFVKFFQYKLKLKNRLLSIIAVIVSGLLLLSLIGVIIVPSVTQEVNKTMELLHRHNIGYGNIPMVPQSWVNYLEEHIDPDQLAQLLSKENIEKAVKQIAPKMWVVLTNTFSVLFSITIIFVIFLYFIFILLDYERIANGWIRLIPERYRPFIQGLADDVEYSMNRYFRGQACVAFLVGILFSIGFSIVGLPLAILLGLFIGLLNMVPYLQVVGFLPTLLLCMLKSVEPGQSFWWLVFACVIVFVVVQLIEDMILVPRIMGHVMGLNPAIILLSLSIWGTLLGLIGMIIALPLTTLLQSYYERYILREDTKEDVPIENSENEKNNDV